MLRNCEDYADNFARAVSRERADSQGVSSYKRNLCNLCLTFLGEDCIVLHFPGRGMYG